MEEQTNSSMGFHSMINATVNDTCTAIIFVTIRFSNNFHLQCPNPLHFSHQKTPSRQCLNNFMSLLFDFLSRLPSSKEVLTSAVLSFDFSATTVSSLTPPSLATLLTSLTL